MPWVAHSSPFTTDGQGLQRVSAGAPPVLRWCSSVVGAESDTHHNLCQIVVADARPLVPNAVAGRHVAVEMEAERRLGDRDTAAHGLDQEGVPVEACDQVLRSPSLGIWVQCRSLAAHRLSKPSDQVVDTFPHGVESPPSVAVFVTIQAR